MTTRTQAIARYWAAATQRHLVHQVCASCGQAVFPPRGRCPYCWHETLVERESKGRGIIHTWADDPATGRTFVLVKLDEGFHLFATVAPDADAGSIAIGTRVVVTFAQLADGRIGPVFGPDPAEPDSAEPDPADPVPRDPVPPDPGDERP